MSIFKVKDLDTILIQFLSIDDLKVFCQTNNYYNKLIRPLLQEYYDFYNIVDTIKLPDYYTNKVFMKAIKNGRLNVCKYLFNKYKYDIHFDNICVDDQCAFRLSCVNGHLNVAKWLFSLDNFEIHPADTTFMITCATGHLNVAQWLCTLRPRYSIRIIDGKIMWQIK